MPYPSLPLDALRARLHDGLVIPAHPLALDADGRLSERHQRALTRYYLAAGAGGLAVGVHTTQFAIRDAGLLAPVLAMAAEVAAERAGVDGARPVLIAGACGGTEQAVAEAELAAEHGYDAVLLSLAGWDDADEDALLDHCRAVAEVRPLVGFYLQPAVGGRVLSRSFWRRFAALEAVAAIKVAPFDRYRTLDVVHAVAEAGRLGEVALYTGNDDHILLDLLTTYEVPVGDDLVPVRFAGGLLGHWACWTQRAVEHLEMAKQYRTDERVPGWLLTLAAQITEANAVLFDAAHDFAGCIPGIHAVLHRQGLLPSLRCLDPHETLSPGQGEAVDRLYHDYPHLNDDAFVAEHLDAWLR